MIELIFLDVDGCLTDGKIIYTSNGTFVKEFDVKDGAAIEAWLKLGKKLAIITGRICPCVEKRAKDLKINILYQGVKDKLSCAKEILHQCNLEFFQCAAIGDYLNDKSLLENVGMSFKPKDAHKDLKVDIVLDKKGGQAAVAQMIEILIKKNNLKEKWDKLWL
ncbi:HAD hydrolase family protein [Campylobacter hepaticus]|uniref:3-deoxy-D-manno-octulosonate 8-phosphate phosphatase KdsC n=1 Tax=Campylobacter hepaticus TaxID=1813019 RepID=A0A6A7JRV7_9BACT|nr:HAD hydrolase family protein [Campylobacter hepaticus]AXP08752.1 3-deoxy-D-manno-octulosonate 8-phosphate phosphatase [Campylobacter hepaticus]MCZ0772602.1 HAD hydrolase family protein [Campylobacter hepaticus]MCZ0774070.1 HAD hydrolase family protein [Campylobacter hepaticus]MCZ0775322.1 HAD hydrolase family protein [Campylobacter hepaticus]MDX2323034.1 HAD hydrolase family protein [Campylobacter hepaticus]